MAEAQAGWISGVKALRKTEGKPQPMGTEGTSLGKEAGKLPLAGQAGKEDEMVPDTINGPHRAGTHSWKAPQSMGTPTPLLDQSAANPPVTGPGPL